MQNQIFQTKTAIRWKSFLWLIRVLFVFFVIITISVAISLENKRDYNIKLLTYNAKKLPNLNKNIAKKKITKFDQQEFAKHLLKNKKKKRKSLYFSDPVIATDVKNFFPVRAGFFVNWDINSYFSLQKNINYLNMVLPEWIFQTNSKSNINIKVDSKALNVLRVNKVAIVPIISNFYNKRWNGDSTAITLKNPESRRLLIKRILNVLDTYEFKGINIDFEDLPEGTFPYLIKFSEELHEELKPNGYITTIDLDQTFKSNDFKQLAPYYDFMFLMAYNEHYPDGEPGNISSLNFVENALDKAMMEIPSEKIVLSLGTYGYDWEKNKTGLKISFQNIIALANKYNEPLTFDINKSDLSLQYTDDLGVEHEAHYNDAPSIYNLMRSASDYHSGGVAVWYLGSEDPRIWQFFNKNLSSDTLRSKPFNFRKLENIESISSIDYDGKGEILEIISEPTAGKTKLSYDKVDQLISGENYLSLPSSYLLKRYGADNAKKIAITFDDGPDENYTPQILDILKEKKIPATFFVIGMNIESNIPLIKRIYNEGHEIGNHTFTHPNLGITSDNRERIELRSTRLLLESILGYSTVLFRPPYNTDAEPKNLYQMRSIAIANDENFISVTSFIDPNDWEENVTEDSIVARAINNRDKGNIILLHDAGGTRTETIKALPKIIDFYKSHGYQFVSVSSLMGKSRNAVMPPVDKKVQMTEKINYILFFLTFIWENFIHGFFIVAILLIICRLILIAILAIIQHNKENKRRNIPKTYFPKVSIIVPAYNEEMNANRTIDYLLKSDYQNFDIIFVDDGSKDETFVRVFEKYGNHPKVKVITKPNGGKADALNFGITQSDGEIIVCIDADTVLKENAISYLIPLFEDKEVGAVAGNVKVGNTLNFITNWQSIEYTTSQNFERRAFDCVNAILVVPGAIGAFRKETLDRIHGFTTDTMAEDCDLTLRILRAGYKIKTNNDAIALTEAPETVKVFLKQRFRWSFGMMQSFWKHRELLFNLKKKNLGWIVLPNLLIFNFIIPLFSPIVDIVFIAGLFTHNALIYAGFYLMYFLVDCIISRLAYKYDNKKFNLKLAGYLFIQRFVYRQLLFYVILKAYLKAIKGEIANWGIMKRTGNMNN